MTRALALAILALALLLTASAAAWGGGLEVVTTSSDLAALVAAVGGDQVTVRALASPLHDPHAVEVKPREIAGLRGAALLIRVGLDHEPWLRPALAAAGGGPPVTLDLSRAVALLQTERPRVRDERGVHVHALGNPHYWLDPENARGMTAAIERALAPLLPRAAAAFHDNRARFLYQLDAALPRWQAALAPYRGERVVVVHDAWVYFMTRFGLTIAATVEPAPGVAPTAATLKDLVERMRAARVPVLVADPYANASLVAQLAARTGARAVTLVPSVGGDPAATDYFALFDLNVARLAGALAGRGAAAAPR